MDDKNEKANHLNFRPHAGDLSRQQLDVPLTLRSRHAE
jgi:hypothetical protein